MMRVLRGLGAAAGDDLEFVDELGRVGLGERVEVDLAARFPGQRLPVGLLGPGHRFVSGGPVIRVLGRVVLWHYFVTHGSSVLDRRNLYPVRSVSNLCFYF